MNPISILLLLACSSCASMFQPGPDYVHVSSDPVGASVHLDGVHVGQTPIQLGINRSADGIVRLERAGYHPMEYKLPTRVNGTTFLNILWGWLMPVGFLVDGTTGNLSAWHSPNSLQLTPVSQPVPTEEQVREMVTANKAKGLESNDT